MAGWILIGRTMRGLRYVERPLCWSCCCPAPLDVRLRLRHPAGCRLQVSCRPQSTVSTPIQRLFSAAEMWPGTTAERLRRLGKDVLFAGALGLASDTVCQLWVEQLPSIEARRCFALTSFTALYNGALCHVVYPLYSPLSRCFLPASASVMLIALGCTMIDNIIHSPLFYLPSYYLYVDTVQGKTLAEASQHLCEDWLEVTATCFAIWVPVQGINFAVVPPAQRVMFMNVGLLAWNVLLDYMSHRR
jgi:protein Mpv17|eukprot:COSAG02_NODE_589_length_19902_cov_119.928939_7_plen_246_part_00